MQQRVTTLKMDRKAWTPPELLKVWQRNLQEQDRSAGTVTKYTQAVTHFLTWYEQEEHTPLTLAALTPIALIGYRNEMHHEQHKSISMINLRISALRGWCGWMTEQGYLAADPAAHVKLIGGEGSSKRSGLKSAQTLRHTFARSYLAQYPGDVVGLATRLYSQPSVEQLAKRVDQLDINAYS